MAQKNRKTLVKSYSLDVLTVERLKHVIASLCSMPSMTSARGLNSQNRLDWNALYRRAGGVDAA